MQIHLTVACLSPGGMIVIPTTRHRRDQNHHLVRARGPAPAQSLNVAAGRALGRVTRAGLAICAKAYCGGTSRAYHASR
jgi:hypothetical protein